MGRLLTTYPHFIARRFLSPGIDIRTRPLLEVRRRLYDRWRIGPKPDLVIAKAFARFAAVTATRGADVLVSWSSATLEAIEPAHAAGMKVVLERGSTHIRNQLRVLSEAYETFGLSYRGTQDEIVERELAEYKAADAIAVPTAFAADTFVAEGIDRAKLIVNPYGVDLARFTPMTRVPGTRPVRILFVGRVGIQKGVPWLLDAARALAGVAELHLVGPVDDEASLFLGTRAANVIVRGALPGPALAAEYADADIFCLPSLQEGGVPLTLLQAMASGLPSVVTPAAQGPIESETQGLVVVPKSTEALVAALERLVAAPEERRVLGAAARAVVTGGFGWQDYADRALAAYKKLIA